MIDTFHYLLLNEFLGDQECINITYSTSFQSSAQPKLYKTGATQNCAQPNLYKTGAIPVGNLNFQAIIYNSVQLNGDNITNLF